MIRLYLTDYCIYGSHRIIIERVVYGNYGFITESEHVVLFRKIQIADKKEKV